MALRNLNDPSVVSGWNSKLPFPTDRYVLRCIEEEFNTSRNSGNPMLTRTWEICHTEPVQIGERKVDIDGLKITQYVITKNKSEDGDGWDGEKSDKSFGRFRDELILLGFDAEGQIDDENPPCFAKGKVVDAVVKGKKQTACKSPTPEQIRKGQKQGDPIKDDAGKDVVTYVLTLESILGLSTVEVNRPY